MNTNTEFKWTPELIADFYNYQECQCEFMKDNSIKAFKENILRQKKEVKNWEIVSLSTHTYFGVTDSKTDIQGFLEKVPSTEKWTINSVKRISDNKIFEAGETVSSNAKITGFEVDGENIKVKMRSLSIPTNSFTTNIESLVKLEREVLFVTDDLKEIFEGDSYWCLDMNHLEPFSNIAYHNCLSQNKNIIRFSSREKAEEYINLHQPKYSEKDMKECFEESRKTHPLLGFKHTTFKDYLATKNAL